MVWIWRLLPWARVAALDRYSEKFYYSLNILCALSKRVIGDWSGLRSNFLTPLFISLNLFYSFFKGDLLRLWFEDVSDMFPPLARTRLFDRFDRTDLKLTLFLSLLRLVDPSCFSCLLRAFCISLSILWAVSMTTSPFIWTLTAPMSSSLWIFSCSTFSAC